MPHSTSHLNFINLDDGSFGTFLLGVDLSLSIDILPDAGGLASGNSSCGFTLTVAPEPLAETNILPVSQQL
jgi:hypothetical protein